MRDLRAEGAERSRTAVGDHWPDLQAKDRARSNFVAVYAAGLFEGEGSIGIGWRRHANGHRHFQLACAIVMGDYEPVECLASVWGGKIYSVRARLAEYRPMWRWALSARKSVVFLSAIRPYLMSVRLQTKADLALAFQAQKTPGHRWMPAAYGEQQERFYEAMRKLNRRGAETLSNEERLAVLLGFERAA